MKQVLVLTKHRFLGDTIVALPLLEASRRTWPEAHISVLTGKGAATLLQNCPFVDETLVYCTGSGQRNRKGALLLMGSLLKHGWTLRRQQRPDLVLIPDRSFRTALGAFWCGGKLRVGFDTEGRGPLLTHRVVYDNEKPEIDCNLDLLRALDHIPTETTRPRLFVTPQERESGAARLAVGGVAVRWVGIQPGASHAYKAWPLERFAALGNALATENTRLVLIGGREEQAIASQLAATLTTPPLDLTGQTELRETMGVLANLTLFVGNDTGVNHIAAALGTPTVAMFGPTPAKKWGVYGPKNRVIVAPNGTMNEISLQETLGAAQELLH